MIASAMKTNQENGTCEFRVFTVGHEDVRARAGQWVLKVGIPRLRPWKVSEFNRRVDHCPC